MDVRLVGHSSDRMWTVVDRLVVLRDETKEDDEEHEDHESICDYPQLHGEGDTTRNQLELRKDTFLFIELA